MNKGIIVVKVGTAVLSQASGRLDDSRVRCITAQICELLELGYKVILVSSGAIGAGMEALKLTQRPNQLTKLQACAAIGQGRLMKLYEENFRGKGTHAAQILLTQEDFTDRRRFLNAKNTILSLLNEFNSVPVINENDTIATDEIKFGDNDRLSALVANLVGAHTLIMLTDVDGLCSSEGSKKVIPLVPHISVCEKMAKPTKGKLGTGGMVCKLDAAKMAVNSGIRCIIANGTVKDILLKIEKKEPVGTTFLPVKVKTKAKKNWLAFAPRSKGSIIVDDGAKNALVTANKSLLPAGIKDISGKFQAGDVVNILTLAGEEFAKGMTRFSSDELDKIKGLKTGQIEKALRRKASHNEVIHRDDLVILI